MSDCISREDALLCLTGEFEKDKEYSPEELIAMFGKRIKGLPPVTPTIKTGHWIAESDDCISRKELIEKARQGGLVGNKNFESVCKWINSLPPVKPKERTGEWQQDRDGTYLCSECGSGFKGQPTLMGKPMFLYCPLCGVRMKKGEENEC